MRKWLKPGVLSTIAPPHAINARCEAREGNLVLQSQPDRVYICESLTNGFRIGFHLSVMSNMPSARLYPWVVSDYFKKELKLGQLLGLFPPSSAIVSSLNMNHAGVIPKGCKPEKCRLITNLSFAMKCQWWHHPKKSVHLHTSQLTMPLR